MVELGARVSLEEPLEVRVHRGPGRSLLLRVLHVRNRLAAEMPEVITGRSNWILHSKYSLRIYRVFESRKG